jgi:hypothetical protein
MSLHLPWTRLRCLPLEPQHHPLDIFKYNLAFMPALWLSYVADRHVSLHPTFYWLRWGLMNILPWLGLPLPSSLDYRSKHCAQLCHYLLFLWLFFFSFFFNLSG